MRLLVVFAVLGVLSVAPQRAADIVIVNGRIFTGVAARPWADAIAIAGTRITAVGTGTEIKAFTGPATRTIDAEGRLIVPGLNDAHAHPGGRPDGTALEGPPAMMQDPTLDEVLERVKAAVAKAPAGGWIFGEIGATVLDDTRTTRELLDGLTGDHPLMLDAWTGHGLVLNSAAMRAIGLSDSEGDPPGGTFVRTADGKLTGVAQEYACYRIGRQVAALAPKEAHVRAFQKYAAEAASFGISSVQAMATGYTADMLPVVTDAQLPIRLRIIDFPVVPMDSWRPAAATKPGSSLLTVSGVKWILDGTPIERLAFVRTPYVDAQAVRGRLNFAEPDLRAFLSRALESRTQPMFHAVGDAAIRAVLDALEATGGDRWRSLRPRIEHGDMLGREELERAKRLGVIVVQNPSHFMLGPLMTARFGPGRAAGSDIVKSIVEAGVPFAIGSDGPMNPFLNMMFATINEVNPSQALTVEQAVVAYTRGSAYAEFAERDRGTLAPGMLADLAMLSQDIFKVPVPDLPRTVSLLTIVNGRVAHEAR